MSRTIIIGDIHGMLNEFKQLVEKVNYVQGVDRLILVGDLVDRGPDSAGVVKFAQRIGCESVQGNHDNKFVRFKKHEDKRLASNGNYKNPMFFNEDQKNTFLNLSDADHVWLASLPSFISLPAFNSCVVHAGCLPNREAVHFQAPNIHYYARYLNKDTLRMVHLGKDFKKPDNSVDWAEVYDGTINVIYGHNVVDLNNPRIIENKVGGRAIGIDTGAVYGGRLTAFVLSSSNPNGTFVQVDATKDFGGYAPKNQKA